MALVGPITINGSTGNSNWAFKTVVTETAIDVAKKTSTVKVENFLGRTNSTSYFMGTYTNSFEVAGQKFSETIYKSSGDIAAGKFVSLGSHTFTVTQTTTPLTINVKGSYSTSAFTPGSGSASGQVTLSKLHDAPTVTLNSIVEKNTVLAGYSVPGTTFVPYLSKKEFNLSATPYDNAKITKYSVHIGTKNYHNTTTPVTVDFSTEDLIWGYDENQNTISRIMFSATDDTNSRGTIAWASYPVIPYVKPNLIATSSSVKRNGQVSGKVNLNLTGTFYNDKIGSKSNTITLSYKYWKKGTTEPTTYYSIPSNVYTISGSNISMKNWSVAKNGTVITDVAKDSVYLFKIKATDAFNQTSEIELTCAKGEWLVAKFKDRVDFKKITIGGSEIIDSGSNDNGTWIKFANGIMITSQSYTTTVGSTWGTWGNMYSSQLTGIKDYPATFTQIFSSNCSIARTDGSMNGWLATREGTNPSLTNPGSQQLVRPTNPNSTFPIILNVVAIGMWK